MPPQLPRGYAPLLVRTDFADESGWRALYTRVATPTEEGFLANVELVDDRSYADLASARLWDLFPGGYDGSRFFFVADRVAVRTDGNPILTVPVPFPEPDFAALNVLHRSEFRAAAALLWSVENNLSLANPDWVDFTRHLTDGVFRGFPLP